MADKKEVLEVYNIQGEGDKASWTRIGVAFQNQDGSINVLVNYLPVNLARLGVLTLNIRKPNGKKQGKGGKDGDDF